MEQVESPLCLNKIKQITYYLFNKKENNQVKEKKLKFSSVKTQTLSSKKCPHSRVRKEKSRVKKTRKNLSRERMKRPGKRRRMATAALSIQIANDDLNWASALGVADPYQQPYP